MRIRKGMRMRLCGGYTANEKHDEDLRYKFGGRRGLGAAAMGRGSGRSEGQRKRKGAVTAPTGR
jgi:hypothetical protein